MEEYKIFDSIDAVRPNDMETEQQKEAWLAKKLEDISAEGNWQLVCVYGDGKFIFKRPK